MLAASFIMGLFSISILSAMLYTLRSNKENNAGDKLFYYLVLGATCLIFFEILSRFHTLNTPISFYISHTGNFLLYALHPVLAMIWFMHIHFIIHSNEKILKKIALYGLILVGINLTLVLLNINTGFLYIVTRDLVYTRADAFFIPELINFSMLLGTIILIYFNEKRLSFEHIRTYTIVIIIPVLGLLLQFFFEDYPVAVHSVALALIIKFVNLQNKKLNYDYLTGLFNRRQLDYYIEDRIKEAKKTLQQFSVILVDLFDFKSINDTYGHHIGDEALKMTAYIIRNVFPQEDFVARFGGDEFYIVSNTSNVEEIRYYIQNIEEGFSSFNRFNKTYKLSASIGFTIFDTSKDYTVSNMQEMVDIKMYEKKIVRKNKTT